MSTYNAGNQWYKFIFLLCLYRKFISSFDFLVLKMGRALYWLFVRIQN